MNEVDFLLSLLVGLCFLAVCVMLATVRQWRFINKQTHLRATMRSMRRKTQPTITTLVYIQSSAQAFESTVRAIRRNRYGVMDIVLVDDSQQAEVARRVETLKGECTILRRRARTTRTAALQAGYQKSNKGEIVIVIDAGVIVDTVFVKRLIAQKGLLEAWSINISSQLSAALTMTALSTRLEELVWHQHHEVRAYTRRAFRQMRVGGDNFNITKALLAVNCTLLVTVLFGSAFVAGPKLLWYAWVILTTYYLVIVWFRFSDSLRDRITLTLSVPLALVLVPVAGVVRGISQVTLRK